MKLLALDFDGVICDSAPECFVISARAYAALHPEAPLTPRLAAFTGEETPRLEAVSADPVYAAWVRDMPLGNRAEDFGTVLRAFETGVALPDQASYDAFRATLGPDWLAAYHARFYAERTRLSDRDPEGWKALMAPYAPLVDVVTRRAGDVVLAVATSKDRSSVRKLLAAYGLDALIPEDRVLDKESGPSKTAHLTRLHERCGVAFPDITFVDDKANHLDGVAHLGVRCVLAAWGYNGPREEALARERGYLVCSLEDLESRLFA